MRLLVLQSRFASDPMLDHERGCFISATDRAVDELHFRNVMGGVPTVDEVTAVASCDKSGTKVQVTIEDDLLTFDPVTVRETVNVPSDM